MHSFLSDHPGAVHPISIIQIVQCRTASAAKELNKFFPPKLKRRLLPFPLSLSFFYNPVVNRFYLLNNNRQFKGFGIMYNFLVKFIFHSSINYFTHAY